MSCLGRGRLRASIVILLHGGEGDGGGGGVAVSRPVQPHG